LFFFLSIKYFFVKLSISPSGIPTEVLKSLAEDSGLTDASYYPPEDAAPNGEAEIFFFSFFF
jgi:hypothetical protein